MPDAVKPEPCCPLCDSPALRCGEKNQWQCVKPGCVFHAYIEDAIVWRAVGARIKAAARTPSTTASTEGSNPLADGYANMVKEVAQERDTLKSENRRMIEGYQAISLLGDKRKIYKIAMLMLDGESLPTPSASTEALPLDAVAKDFVNFYAAVEMAYRHVNQKSDGTPFGDGYEMVPELGDTLRAFRSTKDCIIRASLADID